METEHVCECEGCTSTNTTEYEYPPYEDENGATVTDTTWLCYDHAADCFCIHCGNFWAGVESFDFSPIHGVCENCRVEYEEPDDDDDGEAAWDYYNEAWYDPKSTLSELEPPETPRVRYIGEDDEAQS